MDPASPGVYTLSLHDALPIWCDGPCRPLDGLRRLGTPGGLVQAGHLVAHGVVSSVVSVRRAARARAAAVLCIALAVAASPGSRPRECPLTWGRTSRRQGRIDAAAR